MKLILKYLWKYKLALLLNFISVLSFILIELGVPVMLANIIDFGITPKDPAAVRQYGIYMGIIIVVGFIGQVALAYFASRISSDITRDIRDDLFEKTRSFSTSEVNQIGVSSLMTRTNNDAYQLLLFATTLLRTGMIAPMMLLGSIFLLMRTSPSLSIILFIAFMILIMIVIWIAIVTGKLSKKQQKNLDRINGIMRESLSGLRVIRAFNREDFQQGRFEEVNDAYTKVSKKLFYIMNAANPAFGWLLYVVVLGIVWFGSHQVNAGAIQVGQLTSFIDYVFHALFSLLMFTVIFVMYPRAAVSAARINEVLQMKPSIDENPNGVQTTEEKGVVAFENVTFAYSDNSESPVLRNISFTANPGETVAFIGSTGSGKSTLIQLIPRFFDVTKGRILVDGVDVRDYNAEALRAKIGFIPQKATLFSGTIRENLAFGKPNATMEEIEHAASIAQATEFISKIDEGYEYVLAEGGTNLSGGQKQRLSIARALVPQPDVYIFDDSFSALDYKTDAVLRGELKKHLGGATMLIVAQRVGTIIDADKIIVLNEGEIVASGTHRELLETSDLYYEIAASQLSKEELV